MQRTKLGEQYVRFTVDGLKQSEADVQKTAAKNELTWGNMARNIAGKMRAAMAGAFAIAAPAAGLLGFARSASQGSKEAEHLSTAMEYLSASVGSIFAPAFRIGAVLILRIADAFNSLSPTAKTWIAVGALAAAGLIAISGAAMVASVAFAGLSAVAGIAWAIISSPAILAVAGILALIRVVMQLVDAFTVGGRGIRDGMVSSNKTWVEHMASGIKAIAVAGASFFNWWARQSAKVSDWLAEAGSTLLEAMGLVDKGTTDMMKRMPKIDPIQIDVEKLKRDIDGAGKVLNGAIPNLAVMEFKARNILKEFKMLPGVFAGMFDGKMKFNASMDVKFESLQGTFDRLQEAFAKGTQVDKLEQIRKLNDEQNKALNQLVDLVKKAGGIIAN